MKWRVFPICFLCFLFFAFFSFKKETAVATYISPTAEELIIVDQYGKKWEQDQSIAIFLDTSKLLFPGAKGSYGFSVYNPNSYPVSLQLTLSETNVEFIPIYYDVYSQLNNKLLLKNKKLTQPYKSNQLILDAKKKVEYQIDWHWQSESDKQDTKLGKKANEKAILYSLHIQLRAEQHELSDTSKSKSSWLSKLIGKLPKTNEMAKNLFAVFLGSILVWIVFYLKKSGQKED